MVRNAAAPPSAPPRFKKPHPSKRVLIAHYLYTFLYSHQDGLVRPAKSAVLGYGTFTFSHGDRDHRRFVHPTFLALARLPLNVQLHSSVLSSCWSQRSRQNRFTDFGKSSSIWYTGVASDL